MNDDVAFADLATGNPAGHDVTDRVVSG